MTDYMPYHIWLTQLPTINTFLMPGLLDDLMVDPSLCPIPPGFEVLGNFSNEFEHFKDTTGYDNGNWGGKKYWSF